MQGDVDVLVDGRGDNETGVLAVVRRQVGAATAQRDAQRAASDDHGAFSWYTCSTTRNTACASAMPGRGWRRKRMSSRNSANSVFQESSPAVNSQVVVRGGPISGSILKKVRRSVP